MYARSGQCVDIVLTCAPIYGHLCTRPRRKESAKEKASNKAGAAADAAGVVYVYIIDLHVCALFWARFDCALRESGVVQPFFVTPCKRRAAPLGAAATCNVSCRYADAVYVSGCDGVLMVVCGNCVQTVLSSFLMVFEDALDYCCAQDCAKEVAAWLLARRRIACLLQFCVLLREVGCLGVRSRNGSVIMSSTLLIATWC